MKQQQEKEILKKVKRIEFEVRKLLSGVSLGVRTSTFKGHGMTFSDIRQYEPGDDIKNFAWQVMARTGEPFVKQFEEERDLEVHVALDLGDSMGFGGKGLSKFMIQAYLLAFLGLSTARSKDKFGGVLFSNRVMKRWPCVRGEGHVQRCLYDLVQKEDTLLKSSNPNGALDYFAKLRGKNTLCILIGDFSKPLDTKLLGQVARRHALKLVHVFDPYEQDMPRLGWLPFQKSLEKKQSYFLFNASFSSQLKQNFEIKSGKLDRISKSFGVPLFHQSTEDVKLQTLIKALKLRKAYG